MDYFISILFVLTVIALFSQIFLLKKKDEKASGIKWFVISAILLECFHAIVAGVFTIVGIPVGIVSTLIVDILATVGLFMYNKKYGKQKYDITKYDIIVISIAAVLTLILGILQFGIKFDVCNFEINDPGNHIAYAGNFILSGRVSSMYLSTYNISLCMEAAMPFMDHYVSVYRVYILCEMWFFFLTGITLYILVRNYIKGETTKKIVPVAIIAYMLSYPWNSMLMGSGYLNTGVILTGIMMILCNNVINDKINKKLALVFMGVGLYGSMVTYTLYAPLVFGATFIAMLYYYKKNKTNIKSVILQVLCMYIIPGLAGCYFMGIFSKPDIAGYSLNIEGYIYKDLYLNLIFFLPFVFIALFKLKEKKDSSILFWYIIATFAITAIMLTGGVYNIFSGYYFSKMYYFISLLLHMLLILYLDEAFEKNNEFMFAYFGVYFFLMFIHISDAEWRINEASKDMNSRFVTGQIFSLMDINMSCLSTTKKQMNEKIDFFDWINQNIDEDKQTAFIGEYYECCWYQGLTKQRVDKYYAAFVSEFEKNGDENFGDNFNSEWLLQFDDIDYLVVMEQSDAYYLNKAYIDTLEVIYRDEIGFVAVMK